MLQEIQSEVLARLDALSAKIGVAVDHLWPALVRYEVAAAHGKLVVTASLYAVVIAAWCGVVLLFRKEHDAAEMAMIGTGILTTAAIFATMMGLPEILAALSAPEAAALKALL